MKTRRGHVQGCNAQAATVDLIIVAAEATPDENDAGRLHRMLAAAGREWTASC